MVVCFNEIGYKIYRGFYNLTYVIEPFSIQNISKYIPPPPLPPPKKNHSRSRRRKSKCTFVLHAFGFVRELDDLSRSQSLIFWRLQLLSISSHSFNKITKLNFSLGLFSACSQIGLCFYPNLGLRYTCRVCSYLVKKGMYFPNCTECTEFIAFQTFRKMVRYPNSCITRIQDEIIKTILYVQ